MRGGDYLDAGESAKRWAKEAVVLAGLISKQRNKEPDSEYQARTESEATQLIKRVVATGEFYLVRAGNTRKGTGTFYTRPQLAVPTVHRTLEPLCYDKAADGTLTPKQPETILGLKVCDPACGSASFLVAALHYLTDALYKSLCHHRHLDDPEQAKKLTLPYGRLRTGKTKEELVPFPPDDSQRGDTFPERIKALLRRHVVERCIYGVDINSLAVELARVSLWVETLDPELPFSFLDHKIKVGNSLVGCWLDRVEDYPLKAWEREGGDGKDGERTGRIETFLKGEKAGNRRGGDGIIKKQMIDVIRNGFSNVPLLFPEIKITTPQVVDQLRSEYERLYDLPPDIDPEVREAYYRDHIVANPARQRLKAAMDEWCAVWFWSTDEDALRHASTPLSFHGSDPEKDVLVEKLVADLKFFHWELEFPDVFTPQRSGFDAVIGNPPWDVMKPNSQEFFIEFDPLYSTYDKQAGLRRQRELFQTVAGVIDHWDEYNARFKALGNWAKNSADPFDLSLARVRDGESLQRQWARHRGGHSGYADPRHPFQLQGSADLNSYKMFAEYFWILLHKNGRLGVILPTGIYSDYGTKDLRETLLTQGRIDMLYAFQNEKNIFAAADHSFKQVVVLAGKGVSPGPFRTRFRMGVGDSPEAHEIPDDLLRNNSASMVFTADDVRKNSPKSLSLVELRSPRDLAIFRKTYDHSFRIGDNAPGWDIKYATEFHMTNDSKLFPPLEKWKARGFRPDAFGRWIGPGEEVALPLYEGSMISHFDFSFQSWMGGHGATSLWQRQANDMKAISPRFLILLEEARNLGVNLARHKILCRSVGRNTLTRTMTAVCLAGIPCGHSLFTLTLNSTGLDRCLWSQSIFNSFCFDYVLRARVSGLNLSWFVISDCPIPCKTVNSAIEARSVLSTASLSFIHRRFAPEWLKLKHRHPELASKDWKHWWAVTEADRLRLRVEIDVLCADLYGLDPDDFDWVVRDDPTDPKGFYRVDRQLPFRERLTGLAAAAFRALKEGKWSAETAASLSNDEFFDLLGIPELTNAKAAHAKGMPGPLIEKRDGCHVWKPEDFPKNDPRHGWTWDDCWKDAVALLGSRKAVESYLIEDKDQTKDLGVNDQDRRKGKRRGPIGQKTLFD